MFNLTITNCLYCLGAFRKTVPIKLFQCIETVHHRAGTKQRAKRNRTEKLYQQGETVLYGEIVAIRRNYFRKEEPLHYKEIVRKSKIQEKKKENPILTQNKISTTEK